MSTTTKNLGLKNPSYEEMADIGVINDNMEIIDKAYGGLNGDLEELHNVLGFKEILPFSTSKNYKLLSNATAVANNSYSIDKYDVNNLEKVIIQVPENGDGTYCFLVSNDMKEVIGNVKTNSENGFVELPSSCNYLFVCYENSNEDGHNVYKAIEDKTAKFEPTKVKGIVEKSISSLIDGSYYGSTGEVNYNKKWCRTGLIEVKENDIVRVTHATNQYIVFFDENKNFISTKNGVTSLPTSYIEKIDSGVHYIGCNVLASQKNDFSITINGEYPNLNYEWKKLIVHDENIGDDVTVNNSVWKNKKYISHGDSITWRDGNDWEDGTKAIGYQSIMNQQIGFSLYVNQGWNGHSMADGTTNGDGCVTRILSLDHSDYDLCTIACGANDFKLNVPIGTIGKIGDTAFDRKTFYGSFRTAIEYLLKQKPTLRIVLFTPLQRDNSGYDVNYTNSAGHKLIDYVNAIKEVGKMYSLPVCDMYANSGFTKLTLATYTIDGLHPNNVGYVRMGNYATQFVNNIGC